MDASINQEPGRRSTPRSLYSLVDATPGDAPAGCRAVIVSGLRLLREGLADALARSTTITVVAIAGDADEARAVIADKAPEVILLDLEMRGSLALARDVRDRTPAPKLVAFAVSDTDDALVGYIEAGIDGFVTRDGSLHDVVAMVESVVRGETIVSPRLAASLFQSLAAQRRGRGKGARTEPSLTSREQEILRLVEQGMANKEIARILGIELATVKNHVHHVLEKLKVSRRGQAAARARSTHDDGA